MHMKFECWCQCHAKPPTENVHWQGRGQVESQTSQDTELSSIGRLSRQACEDVDTQRVGTYEA